jgi:hypothetical protein
MSAPACLPADATGYLSAMLTAMSTAMSIAMLTAMLTAVSIAVSIAMLTAMLTAEAEQADLVRVRPQMRLRIALGKLPTLPVQNCYSTEQIGSCVVSPDTVCGGNAEHAGAAWSIVLPVKESRKRSWALAVWRCAQSSLFASEPARMLA